MSRRLRAFPAIAAALALGLGLSACAPWSVPSAPAHTTSTSTGEKVDPALATFYHQSLSWKGCGDQLQCATARAPLDWADPGSGSVDLALEAMLVSAIRR